MKPLPNVGVDTPHCFATYALVAGSFELRGNSATVFFDPALFVVNEPHHDVSLTLNEGAGVNIRWTYGGTPVRLPYRSIRLAGAFEDQVEIEGKVISGLGLDLATGTVEGLVLRIPEVGIFDVQYTIELPEHGKIQRPVPGVGFRRSDWRTVDSELR